MSDPRPTPSLADRLVTFEDAATALCCSVRKLERLVCAGEVPAPGRVGRSRVYPASVVEQLVERFGRPS